ATEQITTADQVGRGDVVATFLSPADRTRIAGVEMQAAQAEAKRDAIRNRVLQTDEALLQEQSHAQSELQQLQGFAFELQNARRAVERDRAGLTTDWTREESKLVEDGDEAEREAQTGASRLEIARRAWQRALELQKQGHISQQDLDTRNSDYLMAELTVAKTKERVSALQERRNALAARFQASLASLDRQLAELAADGARTADAIAALRRRLAATDQELRADRARAIASRDREVEAVQYDITILAAEKTRLTELGQVRAPFAGRVVYRHSAPGLAPEGAPILAISAGTGFTASIKMPRDELRELAALGTPVQFALDSPVLRNFFTGRFARDEPVPFEPDRVIAYFDCTLPPEIISDLANAASPVRVRLLWRPALLHEPLFDLGAVTFAAALLVLGWGARQRALAPLRARRAGQVRLGVARPPPLPIRVTRAAGPHPAQPVAREAELRSLAARFRRQLRADELRPELLAELEGVFHPRDPHAVRIFREEIRRDAEIAGIAEAWMSRQDEAMRRRLAAVLSAAARPAASGSA
ncbi:MAG TPA: hypothetical protein VFA22_11545, partial [Stellaceae bacterium]|nr:hypothetical protein [Stellaceae bacterium]